MTGGIIAPLIQASAYPPAFRCPSTPAPCLACRRPQQVALNTAAGDSRQAPRADNSGRAKLLCAAPRSKKLAGSFLSDACRVDQPPMCHDACKNLLTAHRHLLITVATASTPQLLAARVRWQLRRTPLHPPPRGSCLAMPPPTLHTRVGPIFALQLSGDPLKLSNYERKGMRGWRGRGSQPRRHSCDVAPIFLPLDWTRLENAHSSATSPVGLPCL